MVRLLLILLLAQLCWSGPIWATPIWATPLVIAHRGASGYVPEHTLESFRLAVEQGADWLEPDLVMTKDGQLLIRHENELSLTTNIACLAAFANRQRSKVIDGHAVKGWFSEDFTLAELGQLRARGRNRSSQRFDDRFRLISLAEFLRAVKAWEGHYGRELGIYPEIKHSQYFRQLELPIEPTLLEILRQAGYWEQPHKVAIQSFEVENLKQLRRSCPFALVQLVNDRGAPADWVSQGDLRDYGWLLSNPGLAQVAEYAQILAPPKSLLSGDLIPRAHQAGLKIHAWTFRAENQFLAPRYRSNSDPQAEGDLEAELTPWLEAGLDGVFCNHPDKARRTCDKI